MKYFNDSDLFELFEFNYTDGTRCETLDMLIEKDGFQVTKTPTVERHLAFMKELNDRGLITGLSVNSNLYTKHEENESDSVEICSQDLKDLESSSTEEDKISALKNASR